MNSGKLFTTKEDVKAFDSALNLGGIEVQQESGLYPHMQRFPLREA